MRNVAITAISSTMLLVVGGHLGCAALVGLGDHELFPDAGDGAVDAIPPDASAAETSVTCTRDAVVGPVSTFAALPDAGDNACRVQAVLEVDDVAAGLDALQYGTFALLDGKDVTGCIGVSFPGEVSSLIVRARAVGDACGRGCANGECGTGQQLLAFYGTGPTTLRAFDPQAISGQFAEYTFAVPNAPGVTHFAVCRVAWSPDKDDVEVDAIRGRCR